MDLNKRIMNIPLFGEPAGGSMAYKLGHLHARRASAELVLKADACIEALRDILDTGFAGGPQADRARKALATFDSQ